MSTVQLQVPEPTQLIISTLEQHGCYFAEDIVNSTI